MYGHVVQKHGIIYSRVSTWHALYRSHMFAYQLVGESRVKTQEPCKWEINLLSGVIINGSGQPFLRFPFWKCSLLTLFFVMLIAGFLNNNWDFLVYLLCGYFKWKSEKWRKHPDPKPCKCILWTTLWWSMCFRWGRERTMTDFWMMSCQSNKEYEEMLMRISKGKVVKL